MNEYEYYQTRLELSSLNDFSIMELDMMLSFLWDKSLAEFDGMEYGVKAKGYKISHGDSPIGALQNARENIAHMIELKQQ